MSKNTAAEIAEYAAIYTGSIVWTLPGCPDEGGRVEFGKSVSVSLDRGTFAEVTVSGQTMTCRDAAEFAKHMKNAAEFAARIGV